MSNQDHASVASRAWQQADLPAWPAENQLIAMDASSQRYGWHGIMIKRPDTSCSLCLETLVQGEKLAASSYNTKPPWRFLISQQ